MFPSRFALVLVLYQFTEASFEQLLQILFYLGLLISWNEFQIGNHVISGYINIIFLLLFFCHRNSLNAWTDPEKYIHVTVKPKVISFLSLHTLYSTVMYLEILS